MYVAPPTASAQPAKLCRMPRPASSPTTTAAANAQSAAMSAAGRTKRIASQRLSGRISHTGGSRAGPSEQRAQLPGADHSPRADNGRDRGRADPEGTDDHRHEHDSGNDPEGEVHSAGERDARGCAGLAPGCLRISARDSSKSVSASWMAFSPKSGQSVSVT